MKYIFFAMIILFVVYMSIFGIVLKTVNILNYNINKQMDEICKNY